MSVVDLQNRRQPFAWLHQRVIFKWKTTQETHTAHAHRQFKTNGRESDAVMAHRPCNSINDVIFAQRVYSKTHFGCNKLIRLKVTKKHTSSATQCVCPSKTNAHNPIERVGSSIKRRIERIKKQRDNIDTHSKRISTKAMMDVPFTWCTQSTGVFVCWIETERIKRWGIKRDASFVFFLLLRLFKRSTRVTVGRIGVRSGIDWASGGRRDALVSSSGAQEENSGDDGDHENEAGHSDADGEISWGYAQLVVFILF